MFNQITVIVIQNSSIKVFKINHFGLEGKRDFEALPEPRSAPNYLRLYEQMLMLMTKILVTFAECWTKIVSDSFEHF